MSPLLVEMFPGQDAASPASGVTRHHGSDLGQQLLVAERSLLKNLFDGSAEALTIRNRKILGSEDDDGYRANFLLLLQCGKELEAVHSWHDQVEQDHSRT